MIRSLIDHNRNIDAVEREFSRMLEDDDQLRADYEEWCTDLGYPRKSGYREYIQELFEVEGSVWDSLTEFEDT